MATFTDRVRILIDVVGDNATRGLNRLRSDFRQADGALGRFKVAGNAAMTSVKNNAAELATAGAAAVSAFAATSVQKFQETALEAGNLADLMSTSAENASRWLEVADDFDIELNDLSDAFNNVAGKIAEGDEVIDDLGVTIERTTSGAVDMDQTMQNVIEAIAGIEDPAERARVAAVLLGEEGSRQFAELTGEAGALTDALNGVGEGNIVTDEQVREARELRDRMEDLRETVESVQLAVGSELVEAINTLGDAKDRLDPLLEDAPDQFGDLVDIVNQSVNPFEQLKNVLQGTGDIADDLSGKTSGSLGPSITRAGLDAVTASGNIDMLADSMDNAAVKTVELFESINQLPGEVPVRVDIDTSEANSRLNQLVQRLQDIGSQATVASVVAANRFNTGPRSRTSSSYRYTGRPDGAL